MNFVLAALELNGPDIGPRAALGAAQSRKPGAGAEFTQRALHGFLLVDAIVAFDAIHTLVPQFPESGLLPRCGRVRPEDLQIEPEFLGELIDEAVGFRKQIPGVDQNDWNTGRD